MKNLIDDILAGLRATKDTSAIQDIEKNVMALVQSALGKLSLVPKEEFDVQQRLLARLSAQVTELEQKITELENKPQD